jgi:virulence-associated protein VapD
MRFLIIYDLDVKSMKKNGVKQGRINYLYQTLLPRGLNAAGFRKIQRSVYLSDEIDNPAIELPAMIQNVCRQCYLFRRYAKDVRIISVGQMADISEVLGTDETPTFSAVAVVICQAFDFFVELKRYLGEITAHAKGRLIKLVSAP